MGKEENQRDVFWAYNGPEDDNNEDLVLLDNVQFIYELALAQLELFSLGAKFKVSNSLRKFKILKAPDDERLKRRLAYFKSVKGRVTDYFQIIQKNRTRSVNQYLTHWIYPYKGKFHPQMIRALLNVIGVDEGDTVLDPFIGSGTTAVEAQLLGVDCIGIDISPLCIIQSKVKTRSVEALPGIEKWECEVKNFVEKKGEKGIDDIIKKIRDKRAQDFFRMAVLVAKNEEKKRGRDFASFFFKNLELMISSAKDYLQVSKGLGLRLGEVDLKVGDAKKLRMEDNSVDGIVTSPPYSIALDYLKNDADALEKINCDIQKLRGRFMGVRGIGKERVLLYEKDLEKALREMHRVLKPGKHAVIIIGNAKYQEQEIKTVQFVIDCVSKIGFELIKKIDKIIFGLYNIMLEESILILKKG